MIRRIIWFLIIIGITYGIYNWIDPEGATALVHRIQSFIGKDVSTKEITPEFSGNSATWIDQPIDIISSVYTGELDTWSLVELDYILSGGKTGVNIVQWSGKSEETTDTGNREPAKTPVKTPAKTPTSSNENELSQQDIDDIDAFFGSLIE